MPEIALKRLGLVFGLLILIASQTGCYLIKQGYYQFRLVGGAIPITEALTRDDLTEDQKAQLNLILDIRQYVQANMALTPGKNYSTINVKWKRYIWNVSACKPLAFEPYTWWFPIVGSVPYLGYFSRSDAEWQRERLANQGYDVALRRVGGYSSLGYFTDPVWPQMLEQSKSSLIELMVHEMSHATVFFPSNSNFNESFANFVGKTGTLQYLSEQYGPSSSELIQAKDTYADEIVYNSYMAQLYKRLDDVYQSSQTNIQKLQEKQRILKGIESEYSSLPFKSAAYRRYAPVDLNNASLMTYKIYNSNQGDFEDLFGCVGRNWTQFIESMRSLRSSKDPLSALKAKVKELREQSRCVKTG